MVLRGEISGDQQNIAQKLAHSKLTSHTRASLFYRGTRPSIYLHQVLTRMTVNPIKTKVPVPSNTSYLQGSHFTLSQEEAWTPDTRLSTFKKDYVPYNIDDKPKSAKQRELAEIFNKDERYFNNGHSASETLTEFQQKPLSEKATYDTYKLRKTNFKMDVDLKSNDPYLSVQKTSYPPKRGEIARAMPVMDTSSSSIPQGDREKAQQPISDYRDRFRGESTGRIPPSKAVQGPSTIRGDDRSHGYSTTHNDNFDGKWDIPVQPVPAHRGSDIPIGDPEKEWGHQTEFQTAYKEHSGEQRYRAPANMQKTQFRLDDGHNTYNDWNTTMRKAFVPKEQTVERSTMGENRNRSDVPDGDTDRWRQAQRGCTTTYSYDHKAPPSDFEKTPTVNGSSIRTKSQVPFGDPDQFNEFYKTTNQEVYVPQNGEAAQCDPGSQGASHIPLQDYDGMQNTTTQKTDFIDPKSGRHELNEQALNRIKKSNIGAPLGAVRFFSTTHQDHFTPVELAAQARIDAARLQKSSVPLGTFQLD